MTSDPHELPPSPLPGGIGSYIHAGGKVGVLIELACESEFVSRTEEFSQLMHDIAMQIAASDPKFIRKEDVTPEANERHKDICRAIAGSEPAYIVDKLFEERMAKFYEEVCLFEQPCIKDQTMTVSQFIATKIAKLGENISVRRFVRFKVGDTSRELEGGDEAGIAVKKPKGPRLGSGSAAVKPDAE
jgi:elongation factor Ts